MSDSTERWQALQELYQAALERTPSARDAYLREACTDEALRSEVMSLLRARSAGDDLLEHPALGRAMPTLETGASIGVYRIEQRIGAGGMGEVYRATDTRLHRPAAIKVLPAVYAADSEWLSRFHSEARALASLHHPHITSIYAVEESGGVCALAMELAEGPTLAARLDRGPISLGNALALAKQIAEALEYAHEKGIIHRDLKPANIKITPEGEVKVLDFGLAKATQTVSPEDSPVNDATPTPTKAGAILGTPGYMSPEQATGIPVDRRADVWAFGVVFFEMLTGRRLYPRTSVSETIFAVMRDEAPWDELPVETPVAIRRLLKRCLEKDPKRRLHDIGEARITIEDCVAGQPDIQEPQPVSKRRLPIWAIVAVLAVAAGAVGMEFIHRRFPARSVPSRTMHYRISLPGAHSFSVSPDGKTMAFLKDRGVWVQPLNDLEPRLLPGTTWDVGVPPFWSPDSRFLVFYAQEKLKKVDLDGNPPVTICSTPGFELGGAWSRAGVIIFGTRESGLMRVPETGGDPVPLTVLDRGESSHRGPAFLPDGRHFVYTRVSKFVENTGIYVGSLDVAPPKQSLTQLVATPYYYPQVVALPGGNASLLFQRDDTLWTQQLDTSGLALTADPLRVADHISAFSAGGFFSAPSGDVLVYRNSVRALFQMAWFDRNGKRIADAGDPIDLGSPPALSPDETRIVLPLFEAGRINLWMLDLAHGIRTRLTGHPAPKSAVLWSGDGKRLVFFSAPRGRLDLYQMAASGEGLQQFLYSSDHEMYPTSWSPDGQFLAYETAAADTKRDVWILPLEGTGKLRAFPLLRTAAFESSGSFCPAGRWFAYDSDYSGHREVYIQEFAPTAAGFLTGPRKQVSKGGGRDPHWQFGGKELFYVAPDDTLMSVEIPPGPALKPKTPQRLFSRPRSWLGEADSDGKKFLFAVPKEQSAPQPFTVVLNWEAELKSNAVR